MPTTVKLNLTLLAALLSIIMTAGSVVWYASTKAAAIEEVRVALRDTAIELRSMNNTVQQLDARYGVMAKQVDTLESRIHSIASSLSK